MVLVSKTIGLRSSKSSISKLLTLFEICFSSFQSVIKGTDYTLKLYSKHSSTIAIVSSLLKLFSAIINASAFIALNMT